MNKLLSFATLLILVNLPPAFAVSETSPHLAPIQRVDLAHAEAAFSRYLSSWNSPEGDDTLDNVFVERALIELTLPARPEWTINVGGRVAIAEYVQSRRGNGDRWTFSNVQYYPTLERGVVFVQYDAVNVSYKAPRAQRNLVVIELEGARIARLRDFTGARLVVNELIEADPSAQAFRTLAHRP